MKIIVTGFAGFIGSNLTKYLLDRNYEVVGIDNFNDFYNPKIKEYHVRDFKDYKNFTECRVDLLDVPALSKVLEENKDARAVIHLAAYAGVTYSLEHPVTNVKNNIEGTVNLLEECRKQRVNNIIFASTSSVYGNNPTPFVEEMNTDMPLAPYPASKKACEEMLYVYSQVHGMNVTILRIFNPCGPKMRPDLAIPILVRSCIYGDVEFKQYWSEEMAKKTGRDYCYINHIFEAMENIIKNPMKYEIFNLGNSSPVSLFDLVQTVEKAMGAQAKVKIMPARPGEMFMTYANIDRAKEKLGYNPVTSLEQIVKIYHDWYVNQEEWYKKGEY